MYHKPVLLNESIDGLNLTDGGIYIDATFGGGGHSSEILRRMGNNSRLYAIDHDLDAQRNKSADSRFTLIHGNFRFLVNYLDYYKIEKVDGILADFGVSSHQFDVSERGFSFRLGGSLDMRMNVNQTKNAQHVINECTEEHLYYIFKNYCDIDNPGKLVSLITSNRIHKSISDIETFMSVISPAIPRNKENKYLAQVFQAIRIDVNDEITSLCDFLNSTVKVLKKGGRLSVISYHSLEDKPVKNLIRTGNTEGTVISDIFGRSESFFKAINRQVIVPDEKELEENPRSRSAKLRIAEKL
jgi:16S rRNA (cytosine1402-N4)-methyltransferase